MKTLNCDVCHFVITEPFHRRNYFHIAHRDLCESCRDKLDYLVKPVIRSKTPFDYNWFNKLYQESIEQSIKKGKVDVKIVI